MKIGYVRSNNKESIEEQIKDLSKYGVDKMFIDRKDELSENNSEFLKMMNSLKSGDIVIIDEVQRLGVKSTVVIKNLKELKYKKVNIISLGEGFNDVSDIIDYIEDGIGKYMIDMQLHY